MTVTPHLGCQTVKPKECYCIQYQSFGHNNKIEGCTKVFNDISIETLKKK